MSVSSKQKNFPLTFSSKPFKVWKYILNQLNTIFFLSRETEGLALRCLGSGLILSAVPHPASEMLER
ncbi:hypothetical protein DET59_11070 [Rossellomorea aquimaris]|uniref:Uncharacterized protein n=1 Tax=Rossellomorea aquimaris TaxID=189382 RepID=A0A366ELA1_9BACI|nr:hypothetical protein DET59_11070 [Rossellomorea aquimaris]